MKKYTLIVLLLFISVTLKAQTLSEWFRQRKTQIKYLKEQIAALKVYGDYTRKGYEIAKNGLTLVGAIKDGDVKQHREYFTSLSRVNAKIKSYWKTADIVALGLEIAKLYQKQKKQASGSGQFTGDEITYMTSVFTNLLDGCSDLIAELTKLTTDDTLEMKDDERLKRIDAMHADMKDKYLFARHFDSELTGLLVQRLNETRNVNTGRMLYGVH